MNQEHIKNHTPSSCSKGGILFLSSRIMSMFSHFRHISASLIRAVPHLLTITFLLLFSLYIFALIGQINFGSTHPKEYGTLTKAFGTLAQSMLMEHTWSERLESLSEHYQYAWVYIYSLIIVVNYLLLHLVIGVLVTALHKQLEHENEHKRKHFLEKVKNKNATLEDEEHPLTQEMLYLFREIHEIKAEIHKINKQA